MIYCKSKLWCGMLTWLETSDIKWRGACIMHYFFLSAGFEMVASVVMGNITGKYKFKKMFATEE